MSYRRGNGSVEVELAGIQQYLEGTSDELDGENGVIRQFRNDRAERAATVRVLKIVAAIFGSSTFVQLVIWLIGLLKHGV